MELANLNFGKELDLPTAVASRIYWTFLKSEQDRRLLAQRDAIIEYCAFQVANELGEPIVGKEAKKAFLASVKAIMDRIRKKDRLRQALRIPNPDFERSEEFLDYHPSTKKGIPQQLHLPFPF